MAHKSAKFNRKIYLKGPFLIYFSPIANLIFVNIASDSNINYFDDEFCIDDFVNNSIKFQHVF